MEWSGAKDGCGYGTVHWKYRHWRAHRLAWFVTHGEIPDGQYVCHRCDNPACINPEHLFLGNQTVNMKDMYKKRRQPKRNCENNGNSKLSWSDVLEIRKLHTTKMLSQKKIAQKFCVGCSCIFSIVHHQRWKEAV